MVPSNNNTNLDDIEADNRKVLPSSDQFTDMTQDNNSVSVSTSTPITKPVSNIDRTLKSTKSERSGSILVRVDSSVLEMASSLADELNISDRNPGYDDENERNADLCCLFCCDLVRACVICDIFDIVLTILLVIASFLDFTAGGLINTVDFGIFATNTADDYVSMDDDEMMQINKNLKDKEVIITVMLACGVMFSIVGIVGAIKFQKYLILVTAVWFCVDVVRSGLTKQWLNAMLAACFAYPHFALFHALRKEQITKENYERREKHCCGACECCVR